MLGPKISVKDVKLPTTVMVLGYVHLSVVFSRRVVKFRLIRHSLCSRYVSLCDRPFSLVRLHEPYLPSFSLSLLTVFFTACGLIVMIGTVPGDNDFWLDDAVFFLD